MPENTQELPVIDVNDVPLDIPGVVDPDMPLDNTVLDAGFSRSKSSKVMDDMHTGHTAIIEEHINDTDILEAYQFLQHEIDKDNALADKADEKVNRDLDVLEEVFVENPGDSAPEIRENADAVRELQTRILDAGADIPRQVIDAATGINADPDEVLAKYAQLTVLEDINKLLTDRTWMDTASDIGKSLLPGKILLDNLQVADSFFNADTELRNIIVGWRALDPVQQIADWPHIKTHLLDTLPEGRALEVMSKFMNPIGEEDLSSFNAAWAVLDLVDVSTLGGAVLLRMNSLRKGLNSIKMTKDLDKADIAAEVNTAAVLDATGEVAEKAGIDKVTAYSNTNPINVSIVDEAYTKGLSKETLGNIDDLAEEIKGTVGSAYDETLTLREGILDKRDRAITEAAFKAKYEKLGYENIEAVERTSEGTVWKGELVGDNGTVKMRYNMDLKLNDVTSTFEMSERGVLSRLLGSKTVLANGAQREAVSAALRLDSTSAVVSMQLQNLQRRALQPVIGRTGFKVGSKQAIAELDDVLRIGDDLSKTFTVPELRAGVNGVSLGDKQIEAYYNLRNLYNGLHSIRNVGMRRSMVLHGYKNLSTVRGDLAGKVFEGQGEATNLLRDKGTRELLDLDSGQVINIDALDLDKLYARGGRVVQLNDNLLHGEQAFKTVIVHNSSIGELPEQVLRFREGYIPRVTASTHFVKEISPLSIDGVVIDDGLITTIRQFDTKADADTFLDTLRAENPEKKYLSLEDRQLEKEAFGSGSGGSGGGLYTGARAKEKIPFGLPDSELQPEVLNAFEATSRNINQLSNFVSRNEWKMGMMKRWENTAKEMGIKVDGFNPRAMPDTQQGNHLRDVGEQMEDWFSFPSKGELLWEEFTRDMMEFAMGRGAGRDTPIVRGLHHLSQKDPIMAARSAAFHTLLGFLNPAQLWVQAQGTAVALAIDPIHAPRNVQRVIALTMIDHSDNLVFRSNVAKSAFMKADELEEIKALWDKTGLRKSILNTADHAASVRNQGIAGAAMTRAADAGLLFYRGGELFNRRFSFMTALHEWKRLNKGAKVSDAALKGILTRSNDMMLNLSKANRAKWQRGLLSVPTQFLQVQAKMFESVLGVNGRFTGAERGRILLGQMALYGTAGIPFAGMGVRWFMEATGKTQEDIDELDPLVAKTINDGFWGWFALATFDADLDISRRGSTTSGMETFVFDLLASNASVGEKLLGAFGQFPTSVFKAFNRIKPMVIANAVNLELPSKSQLTMAVMHASQVLGSMSNVDAARFMFFMQMTRDTRGYPEDDEGFSLGTVMARSFGFRPSTSKNIRDLNSFSKALEDHKKNIKDRMVDTFYNYALELELASNEEDEALILHKYEQVSAILMQSLPTDKDVNDVRDAVNSLINSGETKKTKTIKRFLNNFVDGQVSRLHTIGAQLKADGIMQTGVLQEEEEE